MPQLVLHELDSDDPVAVWTLDDVEVDGKTWRAARLSSGRSLSRDCSNRSLHATARQAYLLNVGRAAINLFASAALCCASGCGITETQAERNQLEPLHGIIDPDELARPAAVVAPSSDDLVDSERWRVSNVIDGRTLELYRGLERTTAVLGGIIVPVDDECLADRATASMTFITGGGRPIDVSPPAPVRNRIDDATIVNAAGDDLAGTMLALGLARVDDQAVAGRSDYVELEAEARNDELGIWSDECDDD